MGRARGSIGLGSSKLDQKIFVLTARGRSEAQLSEDWKIAEQVLVSGRKEFMERMRAAGREGRLVGAGGEWRGRGGEGKGQHRRPKMMGGETSQVNKVYEE